MKLDAQERTVFGKQVRHLRAQGQVPAEIYGHGMQNMHVSVMEKDIAKAISEVGHSGIIMLGVNGKETRVLAHTWETDYRTGAITHVDFHRVKAGEKIDAEITIVFMGTAPAVKELGGVLVKNLHTVEVHGTPEHIPHEIEVSLDELAEIGATLHARDLKLPTGVTLVTDADAVLVTVALPQEEEENDITVDDVVVEGEKKEDENA